MIEFPSRESFVEWLQGMEPDERVGRSGSDSFCPLANFVQTLTEKNVAVYGEIFYIGIDQGKTPEWAHRFIRGVDRQITSNITAKMALEVLNVEF